MHDDLREEVKQSPLVIRGGPVSILQEQQAYDDVYKENIFSQYQAEYIQKIEKAQDNDRMYSHEMAEDFYLQLNQDLLLASVDPTVVGIVKNQAYYKNVRGAGNKDQFVVKVN